jgi:AcrR family transcriptional regulator
MESRCRILDAAARVYAEFGFRGATTRRIATAAGVNEVTLFRTFGSKEALIEQALRHHAQSGALSDSALPEHPVDPQRELTAWARAQLSDLRARRALIRKTMGELEERPDLAPTVTAGWATCDQLLHDYLGRLRAHGFVAPDADGDLVAGGSMLMAALFTDAMGRDMLQASFPQPEEEAPAVYVRLFLRAVACRGATADAPDPAALAAAGPHPEPSSAR